MNIRSQRWWIAAGLVCLLGLAVPAGGIEATPAEGDLAARIAHWTVQLADAEGEARTRLLIRRGEAYRRLGHYPEAREDLRAALNAAQAAGDILLETISGQGLAYIHFLEGAPDLAEPLLRSALEKAEGMDRPDLAAVCANRLGTVLYGDGRREAAYDVYRTALDHAVRAGEPALEAGVRRNLARTLADDDRAMAQLADARRAAERVRPSGRRADLLLGIAAEIIRREAGESADRFAAEVLAEAMALAEASEDLRRISEAAGRLGEIHERAGRIEEARARTEAALLAAQEIRADDLLLKWEWRLGRLLRATGDRGGAIAAYRRSVYHIEAIRQDIPIRYQDGRSSFRETLAPIYMGLADMLLAEAAEVSAPPDRQALLREAQSVVEKVKRSELTDYFRDPCVAALSRGIETLAGDTAVIYPIILPDRLALLVEAGGRLTQRTSAVRADGLEAAVTRLTRRLRRGEPFETASQKIHDWLIRPILPVLTANEVETLVYVPDGVLRLLPIAALWDGERFLVEQYSVVTVPGLTLLASDPLARGEMVSLMAGMSEPGPVIYDLPGPFWDALTVSSATSPDRGVRGLTVAAVDTTPGGSSAGASEATPETVARVRRALALPGVDAEIAQLSSHLPGTVLLNDGFRLDRFTAALGDSAYRVIHIASHGYFGGKPADNFIMTYDARLDMNRLEEMIRPTQLADRPVELITLSACQTAEGDDRSPLGLSGVVLKSGARSALGSLWPVSDNAAQILLPSFYTHLEDAGASKAEALRRAQVELLRESGFRHPFYWSPFILVGAWL